MYHYVWIVFRPTIADEVPDQAHYFHRVVWHPCLEAQVIEESCRSCLRGGVYHELKHCLKNALCQCGVNGVKGLKVDENKQSRDDLLGLFTPQTIQALVGHFGYCQDWEM
jgi:hypothetical protein